MSRLLGSAKQLRALLEHRTSAVLPVQATAAVFSRQLKTRRRSTVDPSLLPVVSVRKQTVEGCEASQSCALPEPVLCRWPLLGGPTWASLQSTTGWLVGSKRWCVAEQLVEACEVRGAAGASGGGCMQVYNTPETHVTRDYREGVARLGDLSFVAIDTSGALPARPKLGAANLATRHWPAVSHRALGCQGWSRSRRRAASRRARRASPPASCSAATRCCWCWTRAPACCPATTASLPGCAPTTRSACCWSPTKRRGGGAARHQARAAPCAPLCVLSQP